MKPFAKRFLALFLALLLLGAVFSAAALSAAAENNNNEVHEDSSAAEEEDDGSFWEDLGGVLGDIWDGFWTPFQLLLVDLPGKVIDFLFVTIPEAIEDFFVTMEKDATEEFLNKDYATLYEAAAGNVAGRIYDAIYPFGVMVLLLSWLAGVCSAGLTLNLDLDNKYSILRAVLQLMIGITLLSATPELLSAVFAICDSLRRQIVQEVGVVAGHSFILFVFRLQVYLNLARLALTQSIAPLFVGFSAGGEGARRIAINYAKEYAIVCLETVYATIYVLIVDRFMADYTSSYGVGIVAALVLAFSVFAINRRLEKLFH